MKIQDIQKLKPEDLQKTLASLREQVRDLQFKINSKEVKNNHKLTALKKDIARILTVINAK